MAAQTLAANGAKVYITGRRKDVLEASAKAHGADNVLGESGGSIVPLVMDITSKNSIAAAVAHVTKQDGYLNLYAVPVAKSEYSVSDNEQACQ